MWPVHNCIKGCFRHGKAAPEPHEALQTVIGDNFTARTRTFEWLSQFKRGWTSVDGRDRQSSPSIGRTDVTVQKVGNIINEDRPSPMSEIAGRLGPSYVTCQGILREGFNVWKICARFMPRLLTHETQQREFLGARVWLWFSSSLLAWCPFSVSSCFQEWNRSYKDVVSRTFHEFRSNRWPSYRKFQNVSSNNKVSIYFVIDEFRELSDIPS